MQATWDISHKDVLHDASTIIHNAIVNVYKNSDRMPLLPTVEDLDHNACEEMIPDELKRVMNIIVHGEEKLDMSQSYRKVLLSISQDICRDAPILQYK